MEEEKKEILMISQKAKKKKTEKCETSIDTKRKKH